MQKNFKKCALWLCLVIAFAMASTSLQAQAAPKVKKVKVKASNTILENSKTIYIGGPKALKSTKLVVTVTPKKASVKMKYVSSDKKVATVSSKGKVTAKKKGKATITVTSKSNKKVSKKIKITVKKYVYPKKLTAKADNSTIYNSAGIQHTTKLKAVFSPSNASVKKVTYKSSSPSLAAVSDKGVVTANNTGKTGTVIITVKSVLKSKKGKTLTVKIPIKIAKRPSVTEVKLNMTKHTLTRTGNGDATLKLKATISPAAANNIISWSTSDAKVATVSSNGEVKAKKAGKVVITASADNGKRASCTITIKNTWISIHDPSIVQDNDGMYYLFGTHLGAGKSKDLTAWTNIGGTNLFGTTEDKFVSKLSNIYTWMNISAPSKKDYTYTWAPSVIYNKTTKKYYYYACTSEFGSTDSVIWFATADKITGPYSKATPIIYSGFTNTTTGTWSYNRTNIRDLIQNNTLDGISSSWFESDGAYKSRPGGMPNAIDPCVFYDEDGKMWMVYGSFSGGIYILEIDTKTGVPKYPARDDAANHVVAYFGKQITTSVSTDGNTNGNGEGPFIMYDKASDAYYLYITYGGLAALDGYNVRVFRSDKPDGPYVDAAGTPGTDGVNKGLKMMGNYKLSSTDGYLSPGHSSELADRNGQLFHIYHTRFNDGEGMGHQVRVHQMFVNSQGFTVPLPFEYNRESLSTTGYSDKEVVGNYSFINHGNTTVNTDSWANVSSIMQSVQSISLNSNGTVSGDVIGTWEWEAKNSPRVKLTIQGTEYYGMFCYQSDESENRTETMVFAAAGANNCTIWGVKQNLTNQQIVTRASTNLKSQLVGDIRSDLPTTGFGNATITYDSQNTAVISNTGKVTRADTDITVRVTVTIKSGDKSTSFTQDLTVKAKANPTVNTEGVMAKYTFDLVSALGEDSSGNNLTATTNDTTYVASFNGRNGVLRFSGNKSRNAYVKLPAALSRAEDFTFTGWVYCESNEWWQRIFDLGDGEQASGFLTNCGGSGVCRFDLTSGNHNFVIDDVNILPTNTWNHLAVTMGSDGSAALYINGRCAGAYPAGSLKFLLNDFNGNNNYLGRSQYNADAYFKGYMDDITFYGKVLTQEEIQQAMN